MILYFYTDFGNVSLAICLYLWPVISLGISCEKTYQIDVHSDRWLYRCVWGPQGRARSVRDWLGSRRWGGGGGHGAGEGNALEEKGEEAESTERPSEAMRLQQSLGQPSACQGSLRGAEEPRSWHRTALRPRLGLPGKVWCGSSPAGPAAGGHQLIASCVAEGSSCALCGAHRLAATEECSW